MIAAIYYVKRRRKKMFFFKLIYGEGFKLLVYFCFQNQICFVFFSKKYCLFLQLPYPNFGEIEVFIAILD